VSTENKRPEALAFVRKWIDTDASEGVQRSVLADLGAVTRAAVERETAQLRAEIKMLEGGPMTESIATPKQLASKIIDVIDGENGALKLGKEQARKLGVIFLHEERRKTREYAAKLTAAEATVAAKDAEIAGLKASIAAYEKAERSRRHKLSGKFSLLPDGSYGPHSDDK